MDCSWLKNIETRRPSQSPLFYQNKKGVFDSERIRLGLGIDQSHYANLIEYIKYLSRSQNADDPKQIRREIRLQMRKELEPILHNLPPAWVAKCIDQLSLVTLPKSPKNPRLRPRADRRERSRRSVSMRQPLHTHDSRYLPTQPLIESSHEAPGCARQSLNTPGRSQLGYQPADDARPRTVTIKREFDPRDHIMHRPFKEYKISTENPNYQTQTVNFSPGRCNQDTLQTSSKFLLNNWTVRSDIPVIGRQATESSINATPTSDSKSQDPEKLQQYTTKEADGHSSLNTGNRCCNSNILPERTLPHPPGTSQLKQDSRISSTPQYSEVSQLQPASHQSKPSQIAVSPEKLVSSQKLIQPQQSKTSHFPVIFQRSTLPQLSAASQSMPTPEYSASSQEIEKLKLPAAYQTPTSSQLDGTPQPFVAPEKSDIAQLKESLQLSTDIAKVQPPTTSDKSVCLQKTEIIQLPPALELSMTPQSSTALFLSAPSKPSASLKSSIESRHSASREITINETAFMARRGAGEWVLLGTGSDFIRDSDTPEWDVFVSRLVAGLDFSPESDRIFCPWLSYTNGEELVEVFDAFGWRAGLGNMSRRNLCEFRFEVKEQSNHPSVSQSPHARSSSLSTLDSYNDQ